MSSNRRGTENKEHFAHFLCVCVVVIACSCGILHDLFEAVVMENFNILLLPLIFFDIWKTVRFQNAFYRFIGVHFVQL